MSDGQTDAEIIAQYGTYAGTQMIWTREKRAELAAVQDLNQRLAAEILHWRTVIAPELIEQRDRARRIAVELEQQVARHREVLNWVIDRMIYGDADDLPHGDWIAEGLADER